MNFAKRCLLGLTLAIAGLTLTASEADAADRVNRAGNQRMTPAQRRALQLYYLNQTPYFLNNGGYYIRPYNNYYNPPLYFHRIAPGVNYYF